MLSEKINEIIDILNEQAREIRTCEAPDTGWENRFEELALEIDIITCKMSDLSMEVATIEMKEEADK